MRVAFLGTPSFAVPSLRALFESVEHEVVCVVTQPDKPVGRGGRVSMSAVKEVAVELGIPVLQPERISREVELFDEYRPDVLVTCAFGQMLRQNVLHYAKYGVINVHGSLLPKYRGSSPIQWSIIEGEKKTGVTIMRTDIGMDTGDMIAVREMDVGDDETAGELFDRMSVVGAELLIDVLGRIERGEAEYTPQNHDIATKHPMLKKEDGRIDWSRAAVQIKNQVRGMNPWPGAFFVSDGQVVKLHRVSVVSACDVDCLVRRGFDFEGAVIGSVVFVDKKSLWVKCGDSSVLSLDVLQASGGKSLSVRDFVNGRKFAVGGVLD